LVGIRHNSNRRRVFKGLAFDIPRPWLLIKIINPDTGHSRFFYGLVDTGADETSIPAIYARMLGHKLKAGTPKRVSTAGGTGKAYQHTTTINIYNNRS
jgi:predicted aspartyl protease